VLTGVEQHHHVFLPARWSLGGLPFKRPLALAPSGPPTANQRSLEVGQHGQDHLQLRPYRVGGTMD